MVSNPIKKKTNTAFILGMVIMLIITLIVGGAIYFLLIKDLLADKKEEEAKIAYVYTLNQNVASGQEITESMVVEAVTTSSAVPTDSFASKSSSGSAMYFPSGYKSKVALQAGTVLSSSLLYEEETQNSERLMEFNMITLQTSMDIGNYIDIRLLLPNGQDLLVITKKEIMSMQGNTIGLNVTEEEILMINSAIVETYVMPASNLYAVQYVEPGIQEESIPTYYPTEAAKTLIDGDANITAEARAALSARLNATSGIRSWITNERNNYSDSQLSNIESGIQEQIQNAQAAREEYLSGLYGY